MSELHKMKAADELQSQELQKSRRKKSICVESNKNRRVIPANGRLAVSWTFSCSESLPYLCLSKPQGQPTDLEILGKLSNFLQINALLCADCLLGFYNSEESG